MPQKTEAERLVVQRIGQGVFRDALMGYWGGRQAEERAELQRALDYLRDGDVLIVTRLDRLARSIVDLRAIVDRLDAKGVGFRALQRGAINTTRSDGKLLLNLLASFAEFENDIRRERQAEGIAKAKAEGRYRGRKPSVPVDQVKTLTAAGKSASAVARELGISRMSV
jgi:DNA invertase Pin-like site-specific DNA recombinase